MAFQSRHLFIHAAAVCKNRNLCRKALWININAAQQILQAVVQLFLIFHNYQRGTLLHLCHKCPDAFALQKNILFQIFALNGTHGNEFFHCLIQCRHQCLPDDLLLLLCLLHRNHIGEFCRQLQLIFAVDAEFFFYQLQLFDICRRQCFVQLYLYIRCGKGFKADIHISLAAKYLMHDSFFDFILQTCQRAGQLNRHIIITMVYGFHFHRKLSFLCDMLTAPIACHASYTCTHVSIPFYASFQKSLFYYT